MSVRKELQILSFSQAVWIHWRSFLYAAGSNKDFLNMLFFLVLLVNVVQTTLHCGMHEVHSISSVFEDEIACTENIFFCSRSCINGLFADVDFYWHMKLGGNMPGIYLTFSIQRTEHFILELYRLWF